MNRLTRREFLGTSAALGAAIPVLGTHLAAAAAEPAPAYKTKLYKSFIAGTPEPENCKKHADAGFIGVELTDWDIDKSKALENRKIANGFGLRIQSVMRGWANLNADDEAERKASVDSVKKAIQTAAVYGADAILLVPCKIAEAGPAPWDFQIEFDPSTCRVSKVADGDNAPYAKYIELQNIATERTLAALEEVIPVAAYEGITVAIENVWNNLWVKPEFFAAFVRLFDSRWIRAYFDMGNHVKYAPTEEWIKALGSDLITKLHIKDYKLDKKADPWKGFCGMGHGTVDWVSVRNVLEAERISSWVSYEEGNYTPAEYGVILDDFIAGKKIVAPK